LIGSSRVSGVTLTLSAPSKAFPVDRASWERISAAASVYSGWHHMQFANWYSHTGTGVVLATSGQRLIGALPFYLEGDAPSPLYRIGLEYSDVLHHAKNAPGVLAGSCTGYRSDLLADPEITSTERGIIGADMFLALGEAVAAGDLGAQPQARSWLALPYLSAEDARLMTAHVGSGADAGSSLEDQFFLSSRVVGCLLDASQGSFDDFVASLPKRRRAQVRQEWAQSAAAAGVEVDSRYRDHERQAKLLDDVEAKHGQRRARQDYVEILRAYDKHLREITLSFYMTSECGEIEAFSTFFQNRKTLVARSYGALGELEGRPDGAYLPLVVYRPLAYAFEHGFECIDLSPGTRAKYLRGGEPTGLWGLIGSIQDGSFSTAAGAASWNHACQLSWTEEYSRFDSGARDA